MNANSKSHIKLPSNPDLKSRAAQLRKAGYLHEVKLWMKLKNKRFLGLDFDRQKVIGNYIVDFYCKTRRIVIEIDGMSHDFKGDYDSERNDFLEGLGLRVIHLQAKDVLRDVDEVVRNLEGTFEQRKEFSTTPPGIPGTPSSKKGKKYCETTSPSLKKGWMAT